MQGNQARTYLRNKLQRSAKRDDRRKQHVGGERQIAGGIAGDVALEQEPVVAPGGEVAAQCRSVIESGDVVQEGPLADQGRDEPDSGGCRQCRVRASDTSAINGVAQSEDSWRRDVHARPQDSGTKPVYPVTRPRESRQFAQRRLGTAPLMFAAEFA